LLKRLAEAVDGHRTGKLVYVVASYDMPNPVAGVFDTKADAEKTAKGAGRSFDVFGPYSAALEQNGDEYFMAGCEHDNQVSRWFCPDTSVSFRSNDLQSIQIISR
jgi:hypothetical protein